MSLNYTISTTGFINYFPCNERTIAAIDSAYQTFGKDIVIINGEDDWYASSVFHVDYLLKQFKIKKLADFHIGISGITKSGAIIAKKDLSKFICDFNKNKWLIYKENSGTKSGEISIYDELTKGWKIFFSLQLKTNTITDLYKRKTTRKEVHNFVNNFKPKKRTFIEIV